MPGRDPEAATRSAQIGAAIHTVMKQKGLSGVELRKRVEKLRGAPVAERDGARRVWLTRRLGGHVNLVQPVTVIYGPTDDLKDIAKALDVDVDRFVRIVNPRRTVKKAVAARKPANESRTAE